MISYTLSVTFLYLQVFLWWLVGWLVGWLVCWSGRCARRRRGRAAAAATRPLRARAQRRWWRRPAPALRAAVRCPPFPFPFPPPPRLHAMRTRDACFHLQRVRPLTPDFVSFLCLAVLRSACVGGGGLRAGDVGKACDLDATTDGADTCVRSHLAQRPFFLNLSYVCPEPVLVK